MFQNFIPPKRDAKAFQRIETLRCLFSTNGITGFLVPRADIFQGEYVTAHDARLSWLTGFTGSAGTAIILDKTAAIFIDGRYLLQAENQVNTKAIEPLLTPPNDYATWIIQNVKAGSKIGFDPNLHTVSQITNLQKQLDEMEIRLVPVKNLIDQIWEDQPSIPIKKIKPQPIRFSGVSSKNKRTDIAKKLREDDIKAVLITLPDSIAWLLNIRGNDVERNPVTHGFALLHSDKKMDLFIDPQKLDAELLKHLGSDISVFPIDDMHVKLRNFSGIVQIDDKTCPYSLYKLLKHTCFRQDPCSLPKAIKNNAEIIGAYAAHIRDGVAMANFLCWLEQTNDQLDEISITTKLEEIRLKTGKLLDISFDTICGSGPHGAIVHYRVNTDSNRQHDRDDMLLIDSGGQYQDGTTDITRTLCLGTPTAEMKDRYTRVLRGMIALSDLKWPKGLAGRDIDAIARKPLWEAGLDYAHGTGHGVGAYLSVHEGPQGISKRATQELLPGMIISNEPGYYKTDAYGIRIENLVLVRQVTQFKDVDMLEFETLTLCPISLNLVDETQLNKHELNWLNTYHARVFEILSPHLDPDSINWLSNACRPI